MSDPSKSHAENVSEDTMKWVYYHGARPLWKYLAEMLDIDITEVCAYVAKEEPIIESEGKKLTMRTVSLPHGNEFVDPAFNNDITFFINCVNTVFETLKMVVQKDDQFILRPYMFSMDQDHNIYLMDSRTKQPLGDLAIAVVPC
jgi:hypothetical protein